VQLRGGDIERERDLLAGLVARPIDRLENDLDRLLVALQVRREAALVADAGRELPLDEHLLQRVEDLGAHAQRVGEGICADRDDHELLEVHRVRRVRAAVDDVHHRHRHRPRERTAEVAIQRESYFLRGSPGGGHRDGEDRVRAEPALVVRAVELEHRVVDEHLVGRVDSHQRRRDRLLDVPDRLAHSLAQVALGVLVAQLDRLVLARARPARHRGTTGGAGRERHVALDGGIAA
jgi:hypothetical protein